MSRRIATLWDNKSSTQDSEEDASRDNRQAFYAGGSEHSGQQILGGGPNRLGSGGSVGSASGGQDSNRLIESLFNHARQSSALVNDTAESGSSSGAQTFPITFYRNGFTMGTDGELREYESPANRQFLECLGRGETPPELASRVRGGMIDVKLDNKANEDFKPQRKTFTGQGHRLGAPN